MWTRCRGLSRIGSAVNLLATADLYPMTLAIAAANPEYAILVVDRRFTRNGALVDDDASKAFVFESRVLRLAVSFAGVAECEGFRTGQWLSDELRVRMSDDPNDFFSGLARAADETIARLRCREKALWVVASGFDLTARPPRPVFGIVTNGGFPPGLEESGPRGPGFRPVWCVYEGEDQTEGSYCITAGRTAAVTGPEREAIARLMRQRPPARAVVGKVVETIRAAADRPAAAGTIGKQMNVVVLSGDAAIPPEANYISEHDTTTAYLPTVIHARGIVPALPVTSTTGAPLKVRRPPRRTDPCTCGSGRKFKDCHGKTEYAVGPRPTRHRRD